MLSSTTNPSVMKFHQEIFRLPHCIILIMRIEAKNQDTNTTLYLTAIKAIYLRSITFLHAWHNIISYDTNHDAYFFIISEAITPSFT